MCCAHAIFDVHVFDDGQQTSNSACQKFLASLRFRCLFVLRILNCTRCRVYLFYVYTFVYLLLSFISVFRFVSFIFIVEFSIGFSFGFCYSTAKFVLVSKLFRARRAFTEHIKEETNENERKKKHFIYTTRSMANGDFRLVCPFSPRIQRKCLCVVNKRKMLHYQRPVLLNRYTPTDE